MNTKVPTAKKSVGFYNVMATYTSNIPSGIDGTGTYKQTTPTQPETDYTTTMNCPTSGDSYNQPSSAKNDSGTKSSPREVSFGPRFSNREEDKEKRKRFLTAKFGKHQMMLVRKRLAVEEWIYDGLRKLYNCEVSLICLLMLCMGSQDNWFTLESVGHIVLDLPQTARTRMKLRKPG